MRVHFSEFLVPASFASSSLGMPFSLECLAEWHFLFSWAWALNFIQLSTLSTMPHLFTWYSHNKVSTQWPSLEQEGINLLESCTTPFRPSQNMLVLPDPPCSAPQWAHSFYARFWSIWWEFANKTFLNYYGTIPVSFVYSLLLAPRGTWSEIFYFCVHFVIDLQQLCQISRVTHSLLYFRMI